MADCKTYVLDSNATGLRYTVEKCPGELEANPVWFAGEPNSYSDFGAKLTTQTRNVISESSQLQKGVITDLEASCGFNQDLTHDNFQRLALGFFRTNGRTKPGSSRPDMSQINLRSVTATEITFAGTVADIKVGHLIHVEDGANDDRGPFVVTGVNTAGDTTTVTTGGLNPVASPTADARVSVVGIFFAPGTTKLMYNTENGASQIFRKSGTENFSALGLTEGEWVYVGGDNESNRYKVHGFARIDKVYNNALRFDKISWVKTEHEDATVDSKTIYLFWADCIVNEKNPAKVVKRTYQFERSLGKDADGSMYEYIIGAVPNEAKISIAQADKVNIDMSFTAQDAEYVNGKQTRKPGTQGVIKAGDTYNTSSDMTRIKLALVDNKTDNIKPLFAFATTLDISIKNNTSPAKAIGKIGAIDSVYGSFEVGGSGTFYFADVEATRAVRNNATVTLDVVMTKAQKGVVIDIPELTLGDGKITIEKDQPITVPLEFNAFESKFGSTASISFFRYLPKIARS